MTNSDKTNLPLDDVLYAFAVEEKDLNAELLDEYTREYPAYADALTELALELAMNDDASHVDSSSTVTENPLDVPAVAYAMSRFQHHFKAVRLRASLEKAATTQASDSNVDNPFVRLDREGIRDLAAKLNVNAPFVIKLRDRLIQAPTIPLAFARRVADALNAKVDSVLAHFSGPQLIGATQFHKATAKPAVTTQQTYEAAVRSSSLSQAQQEDLLKL